MWNEITYPFPNFNVCNAGVWEWVSKFTPHFTWHVIIYRCCDKSQSVISVKAWLVSRHLIFNTPTYPFGRSTTPLHHEIIITSQWSTTTLQIGNNIQSYDIVGICTIEIIMPKMTNDETAPCLLFPKSLKHLCVIKWLGVIYLKLKLLSWHCPYMSVNLVIIG